MKKLALALAAFTLGTTQAVSADIPVDADIIIKNGIVLTMNDNREVIEEGVVCC